MPGVGSPIPEQPQSNRLLSTAEASFTPFHPLEFTLGPVNLPPWEKQFPIRSIGV